MKEVTLYNGTVKIQFDEAKHRYTVNGELGVNVTSVTGTVDKSFILMLWQEKITRQYLQGVLAEGKFITNDEILIATSLHRKKKESAGASGKLVHKWVEVYIKTPFKKRKDLPLPEDEAVLSGVLAFLRWVDEHKVKFVESEKLVYSKKHKHIGTLDIVCTFGIEKHKIRHITDLKTSSGIYEEAFLQTAGYEIAETEESGQEYGTQWILRLDKVTGEFESKEISVEQKKKNMKAFLHLLEVKKWLLIKGK